MNNPSYISNENLVDGTPVRVETTLFQEFDPNQLEDQRIRKENEAHIFTPEFIPYYPDIAIKFSLSATETLVYGFVRFYMKNASNKFYFTNEQLAKIINCSPNTINVSISNLAKKKLILKGHKIKGGGGTIRFISSVRVSENSHYEYQKSDSQTIRNLIANKNKINKNKINKHISDFKEYLDVFNEVINGKYRVMSEKTTRQIKKLVSIGYTIDDWRTAVAKAYKNDYLCGRGDGSSTNYLTPEYISRPEKFQKWLQDTSTKKSWFIPRPKRDNN